MRRHFYSKQKGSIRVKILYALAIVTGCGLGGGALDNSRILVQQGTSSDSTATARMRSVLAISCQGGGRPAQCLVSGIFTPNA